MLCNGGWYFKIQWRHPCLVSVTVTMSTSFCFYLFTVLPPLDYSAFVYNIISELISNTVSNNAHLLSIVMEYIFINHVYICIFITKLWFVLLLNKVTCLFRLRTLFPHPLVLFPAWEEGGMRTCEDTNRTPGVDRCFPKQWMSLLTNLTDTYNQSTTPWGNIIW